MSYSSQPARRSADPDGRRAAHGPDPTSPKPTRTERTSTVQEDSDGKVGRRRFLIGAAGVAAGGAGLLEVIPALGTSTSQNGWPLISSSSSSALDRGFTAAGTGFPGGVRKGDVSTVLRYVATRFNNEVEALRDPGCWGWSYRKIRGGSSYSNHASATAIDCNAPRHPLGVGGTFSSTQESRIHAILRACDGAVRWGGDYSGRKDEMHFEINVSASSLAVVAARLGGSTPPPSPTPPSGSGWPLVRSGDRGFRVTVVQYLLKHTGRSLSADGSFGSHTKAAVVSFQRSRGLGADGIVGPQTWPRLAAEARTGSRGYHVRAAQTALNAHGAHLSVDGAFGSHTRAAAVSFQQRSGLAADGIIGPHTWSHLV